MRRALVVLAGGALGTVGRAGVAELLPPAPAGWPWATLAANLLGALALALLAGWTATRWDPHDLRLAFLGTGVLGSFTTFSALVVEVRLLGPTPTAAAYAVVSVAAGLLAVRAGLAVAGSRP